MKIVVLDGYTLNPGDLSWQHLQELGDVTIYDRTPVEQIVERAVDAEVVLTNKTPLGRQVLEQLPSLQYIGVLATGYNIIDVSFARSTNVTVTNVPGYGTLSVAQLVFALLLEWCHHVQRHSDSVSRGDWSASPDFSYWNYPLIELAGKTMGIIGYGDIGKKTGELAAAFGMNVLGYSRHQSGAHPDWFQWADPETIYRRSDVISLHCPLTPETKNIICRESLSLMKSSAILINTSRGPLVAEADLAEALNEGVIAGAGIDVLSSEPPDKTNPLLTAKNCLITPHIAWATREARARLMQSVVNNLNCYLKGQPVNIVSPS